MTNTNPPRWAALVLNLILKDRDRESIAGDLLEEYREVILPARGPVRGHLWYLAQIVSLMSAPQTIVRHTPLDKGLGFGAMLVLFAGAGFVAQQRTGEIQTAISAGAIGALAGMGSILAIIVVFDGGGLRAIAVEFLIISVALGAFCGAVGGLVGTTVTAVRAAGQSLG